MNLITLAIDKETVVYCTSTPNVFLLTIPIIALIFHWYKYRFKEWNNAISGLVFAGLIYGWWFWNAEFVPFYCQ